jgi:hypothetical protein
LKVIGKPYGGKIFAWLAELDIDRLTNHRADNVADEETRNTIPKWTALGILTHERRWMEIIVNSSPDHEE